MASALRYVHPARGDLWRDETHLHLVLLLLEREEAEHDGSDEHSEEADQEKVLCLLRHGQPSSWSVSVFAGALAPQRTVRTVSPSIPLSP